MDAQKISEAASTIKKVDLAEKWFARVSDDAKDSAGIVTETVGNCTAFEGHGEGKFYLRRAMEIFRAEMISYAKELAAADKRTAQGIIREEAGA